MKKLSDNLDFIKPFENQEESLTDAEKMEAAYNMSALVNDLLLRFADSVSVRKLAYSDGCNGKQASLELRVSLGDSEDLSIVVGSYSDDKGDMLKYIGLGDNSRYRYHMENWDEVLRYDLNTDVIENAKPLSTRVAEISDILRGNDPSILNANMDDVVSRLDNIMENKQLERRLGVNDQPVDPDEIGRLAQLLEGAETIDVI